MNKQGLGGLFCLISAIVFTAWQLSAAIYMSNASSWSGELFKSGLEYTAGSMPTISVIALVVGVLFILWGEWESRSRKKEHSDK